MGSEIQRGIDRWTGVCLAAVMVATGCGGKDGETTDAASDGTGSTTGGSTMGGGSTTGGSTMDASATDATDTTAGTTDTPTTGTTGSTEGPACQELCDQGAGYAMELGCGNLPPMCAENCQTVFNTFVPCQAEWVAVVDCQLATTSADWECDMNGGMTMKDGVCEAEDMAFDACVDAL
jgi:hypothetical protein